MNDTYIVTSYVVIDDMLKAWGYQDDCRASGYGAEILTVAVIAAKYFHNHHERALLYADAFGIREWVECVAIQSALASARGLVAGNSRLLG